MSQEKEGFVACLIVAERSIQRLRCLVGSGRTTPFRNGFGLDLMALSVPALPPD